MLSAEQITQMENGLGATGGAEMDLEYLQKVENKLKETPGDFRLWAARGILYFNEDFQKSIESFSQAIAIVPFDGNQYYSRGRKHMSQDHYEQGLADLVLSLRLLPQDSLKWHFCGVAYFFLQRYSEAIECFEKAIQMDEKAGIGNLAPEYDWIWMAFMMMGDPKNAEKALEAVTKDTPVQLPDLMYKKRILLYKGIISEQDYLNQIERGNDLHEITELFGLANYNYHIKGDIKTALKYLDELLAVKTRHHAWGYKMALLYKDIWQKKLEENS